MGASYFCFYIFVKVNKKISFFVSFVCCCCSYGQGCGNWHLISVVYEFTSSALIY